MTPYRERQVAGKYEPKQKKQTSVKSTAKKTLEKITGKAAKK